MPADFTLSLTNFYSRNLSPVYWAHLLKDKLLGWPCQLVWNTLGEKFCHRNSSRIYHLSHIYDIDFVTFISVCVDVCLKRISCIGTSGHVRGLKIDKMNTERSRNWNWNRKSFAQNLCTWWIWLPSAKRWTGSEEDGSKLNQMGLMH